MRVTMQEMTKRMQYVIADRFSDLSKVQEQLSTGKRLLTASDNPVDTANDLKLKTTSGQQTQFHTNIQDGINFMSVTDTAMASMNTIMQRLRELALRGASDTVSPADRLAIQKETDQLFRQLVTLTNTNYKGDYVFGGTQSKIVPFPIVSSKADSRRPRIATVQPCCASLMAVDCPTPLPAPVTTAFLLMLSLF